MDRHRFEFDQFLFDQAKDAVGDVRSKLIDEAWFGRPAYSPSRLDHPGLGWDLPESQGAEMRSQQGPFESRWSGRDSDRVRDSPEHAPELDFDR
jgi:hypothetical protein